MNINTVYVKHFSIVCGEKEFSALVQFSCVVQFDNDDDHNYDDNSVRSTQFTY